MILETTSGGGPSTLDVVLLALQVCSTLMISLGLWILNDLRDRVKRLEDQFFTRSR
jgi:hypothetical protein